MSKFRDQTSPTRSFPLAESRHPDWQRPATTYVSQSPHKALGCLGAAMITVGGGIFLVFALGLFALLQDKTNSSQDVTAGLIGLSVLLLFPATVIAAIGIYLIVRGRKKQAVAMSLQRTQANMSVTGQMPEESPESQPVTGQTETSQTITLWAKDQQTADSLSNDQYFLYGALMADATAGAKQFLDAWGRGGSLSHEVVPNAGKGGYDVKLTLGGANAISPAHQQEQSSESAPQPEPTLGPVTGSRTESVYSSELLPGQPQPEEDPLSQKENNRSADCDHEWTRAVDQEGTSLRVSTKCTKCGEVMKPAKTVHYDMR